MNHDEPEYPFDPKYDLHDGDFYSPDEMEAIRKERGEQPEEAKPTLKVIQNGKKLGVRAKKKLARDIEAAWNECKDEKHPNVGYTIVPDFVLRAIAKDDRVNPKHVPIFALALAREMRWMFLGKGHNEGENGKWSLGRWASIEDIAAENLTTYHLAREYVYWRNSSPWCRRWRHDRVWHWHPNELYLDFLESGKQKPAATERKAPRKKGEGT
jgi:hypothetical protein